MTVQDLVKTLQQLDADATSDTALLEAVVQCISAPLQWLSKDNETVPLSAQRELVHHSAWKQHIWHVMHDIIPAWTFAFNSTHQDVLEATVYAPLAADSVQVAMSRTCLPVLLECLSNNAALDTLELYARCLKRITKLLPLYGKHVAPGEVRFFCSLLSSIPGHLVNAFGIQLETLRFNDEHAWYTDKHFYAKLSRLCAEHICSDSLVFTQELLGKFIRQGYEDVVIKAIYATAAAHPQHWPTVFQQIEIIASPEQVTKSILSYAIQHVLPQSNITAVSQQIADILFGREGAHGERVQEFLNTAIFRAGKMSWANDILARLVVSTAILAYPHKEVQSLALKYAERAIQTWSDPVFLKHGSTREKEYITVVILVWLAYVSPEAIKGSIMAHTPLFGSVSNYFDSGDVATARLGALVAESVSNKVDKETPLHTGLLDSDERLSKWRNLIFATDALNKVEPTPTVDDNDLLSETESENEELDPDAVFKVDGEEDDDNDDDDDEDSDLEAYLMEEESDDEGLKKEGSSKAHYKKPIFIRDLIRCLQDQNDPLKLEMGLNAAEQVIRRKAGAGTELAESSVELARCLIAFPETFEIDDFRDLQRNALVALMTAVPETVTGFIIDEMYNRNTSAGQKQLILGSISLAVRELAGWKEKEEEGNTSEKRLENVTEQLGKQLFVSKKLSQRPLQTTTQKNRLSGLAGSVFFFPLLVGWWEGSQGHIKYWIGNNPLLTERFIMTLNIILHSATNTPEKRKIVKEYLEFALSMRFSKISFLIQKALLLGIDTIINTSFKDQEQVLFHDYYNEMTEIKVWLEDIMEHQSESKVQEIAITILVKMSRIALSIQ